MIASDLASGVNSPNISRSIEEISLVIAARGLSPTMMSIEFLKFGGIIPQAWELAQQPVLNPNFAQLSFTNGVRLEAQSSSVTFNETIGDRQELVIPLVAENYIKKLPHA